MQIKFIKEHLEKEEIRYQMRKEQDWQKFLNAWMNEGYNSTRKIGKIMAIAREYIIQEEKIPSSNRMFVYYMKHHKSPEKCVNLMEELKDKLDLTWTQAVNYWVAIIFDNSFKGLQNELYSKEVLSKAFKKKGCTVIFAPESIDSKMGVDLLIMREGIVMRGVQCKPSSYFSSTRAGVVNARLSYNPKKYKKFSERYKAPVYYFDFETFKETGKFKGSYFNTKEVSKYSA